MIKQLRKQVKVFQTAKVVEGVPIVTNKFINNYFLSIHKIQLKMHM